MTFPHDNFKLKKFLGIALVILFVSITPLGFIVPPIVCLDVKNDFEENLELAQLEHGFDTFEKWNKSFGWARLDSNCWHIFDLEGDWSGGFR